MDYLVTMGCEKLARRFRREGSLSGRSPIRKGKSIDEIRRIRDMLEDRVKMLLEEVES
jgi:hypothetical protein